MSPFKRLVASSVFQSVVGTLAAWYLRLVWRTNRVVLEPSTIYETVQFPIILTMWHGQHLLVPFFKRNDTTHRAKVLISRSRDGEINARAAERLGIGTIRGSGAHNREFHRKGGAAAFGPMVDAIAEGYNMAMTADFTGLSRVAGMGVVKLAQYSGRPVHAVAIATSRRIQFNSWDRAVLNLPFGRCALVAGYPVYVARDADKDELEAARRKIEDELNRVTARAYEIVDKPRGGHG